jgi:hypothetical protein
VRRSVVSCVLGGLGLKFLGAFFYRNLGGPIPNKQKFKFGVNLNPVLNHVSNKNLNSRHPLGFFAATP